MSKYGAASLTNVRAITTLSDGSDGRFSASRRTAVSMRTAIAGLPWRNFADARAISASSKAESDSTPDAMPGAVPEVVVDCPPRADATARNYRTGSRRAPVTA